MATVNFYLKSPEKSGRSLIYLQFKYNANKFTYTFGQNVDPVNWNRAKQRVKNNKLTTIDGQHSLNDLLDHLSTLCSKTYNDALKNGIPSSEKLKAALDAFVYKNHQGAGRPTLFTLADRFIAGEIKNKGKEKSKGSLQNYSAVLKHLKDFQASAKYSVSFDSVNLDFFYKYTTYLKDKLNLSVNTVAKDISILKVFMGEAVDLGYTNNMQFRHSKFSFSEEETDQVYLSEQELHKLYKFKIENSKLEQVRDLFIFGAWVGLRFSDFSNIKPENIVEYEGDRFIKLITQKTKELVIIPCNPVVIDIFKKYAHNANKLPRTISNQKFNTYIKEVLKLAGMEEIGRLSTAPEIKLYEAVSSHTARRSFATNYYLQGFPTIDLMKITCHKTEKAFLKYIRVSKLDTAKRLSAHIKKNWSGKLMKVA